MDTCSAGEVPVFDLSSFIRSTSPASDTLSVPSVTNTFGGQYRLCWCSANAWPAGWCSSVEALRVDLGGLTLIGPSSFSQDRTCVAGQTCLVDGFDGYLLQSSDSYMVLASCAAGSRAPEGIPRADALSSDWSGSFVLSADGVLRSPSLRFGSTSVTSVGGIYKLCWCAGGFDCLLAGNHIVSVGQVTLIGPAFSTDTMLPTGELGEGVTCQDPVPLGASY
ncbi:unnamed protein product, partial [Polarella glacialis]